MYWLWVRPTPQSTSRKTKVFFYSVFNYYFYCSFFSLLVIFVVLAGGKAWDLDVLALGSANPSVNQS